MSRTFPNALLAFVAVAAVPVLVHAFAVAPVSQTLLQGLQYPSFMPTPEIAVEMLDITPPTTGGDPLSGGAMTKAAGGTLVSDAQCTPVQTACGCGLVPGPHGCVGGTNKFMCPCFDPRGVTGHCLADLHCHGDSFIGLNGVSMAIGVAGTLLKALAGGGSGSGGSGGGGAAQAAAHPGCTSYYQVTVPTSDPCAFYVAPVSNSLTGGATVNTNSSASSDLFAALQPGYVAPASGTAANANANTNVNMNAAQNTSGQTTATSPAQIIVIPPSPVPASADSLHVYSQGVSGDVSVTPSGVTIIANASDPQASAESAGFIGQNASSQEESQSLAQKLCAARPWAGGIVSYLVPPSFFDGLCSWRGYRVGN